jgi:hypothetical protein
LSSLPVAFCLAISRGFFKGLVVVACPAATWLSVHIQQPCGFLSPAECFCVQHSSHPTFCVLQLPRGFLSSYHAVSYPVSTWFSFNYHVVFYPTTAVFSIQLLGDFLSSYHVVLLSSCQVGLYPATKWSSIQLPLDFLFNYHMVCYPATMWFSIQPPRGYPTIT